MTGLSYSVWRLCRFVVGLVKMETFTIRFVGLVVLFGLVAPFIVHHLVRAAHG